MFKHEVNDYSWYVLNPHGYIGSNLLTRINLNKRLQARYDLRKKKFIVIRDNKIETRVKEKGLKVKELKKRLANFRTNNEAELFKFIKENKDYILKVLT